MSAIPRPKHSIPTIAGLALLVLAALAAFFAQWNFARSILPRGMIDATYYYMPRAVALMLGDLPSAFATIHADYPLLWTGLLIAGWRITRTIDFRVPIAFSLSIALIAAGVLFWHVRRQRSTAAALAVTSILLSFMYGYYAAYLMADIPLSLFILLAVTSLYCYLTERRRGWLYAAVVAAGLAMNTKNEGMMFAVIVLAALALSRRLTWQDWIATAVVLLPFAAVFIGWKLLAPTNDLIAGQQDGSTLSKLLTPARYGMIAYHYAIFLGIFGALGFLAARWVRYAPAPGRNVGVLKIVALIPAAMLAGYFLVYLVTPLPLEDQLLQSLDRLMMQLWPMSLFIIAVWSKKER